MNAGSLEPSGYGPYWWKWLINTVASGIENGELAYYYGA
jgi:hypothetical protein